MNKCLVVCATLILLISTCHGRSINKEYVINVKCTVGVVASGTGVGGSVGLTIGAVLGTFVFPGFGTQAGIVIGLILGSSGGAALAGGMISPNIC
ncbi:hypothetical protein PVAND_008386 [Polypedilum vanderplanki]|uniref:Uncharacterized protein n=1 Tax=Polypedilum vanderplanki TaxID=319348 RepID=A0A9J6C9B8_POLVA|nr:hypothetical protein PVAND_008386 [Polypedilum vanderplanki]